MHFFMGIKGFQSYARFLEMEGILRSSKMSYIKPYQVTHHFKGFLKRCWMVKTITFPFDPKKNCAGLNFVLFYYAKVWEHLY